MRNNCTRSDGTNERPRRLFCKEDAGRRDVRLAQRMDHSESSTESMAQHLIKTIEQFDDDFWKIEVWASALLRFASAVPVYDPGDWIAARELHTAPIEVNGL